MVCDQLIVHAQALVLMERLIFCLSLCTYYNVLSFTRLIPISRRKSYIIYIIHFFFNPHERYIMFTVRTHTRRLFSDVVLGLTKHVQP